MAHRIKNEPKYPPPQVQHIVPPMHIKTSACGWTGDPRNITPEEAKARIGDRLTEDNFTALMSEGWCGNCLHVCFDIGDWLFERQWVSEDPTNEYSDYSRKLAAEERARANAQPSLFAEVSQ